MANFVNPFEKWGPRRLQKGFDLIVSHVLLPAWRGGKCVRLHPENARDFKLIDFCAQGGEQIASRDLSK